MTPDEPTVEVSTEAAPPWRQFHESLAVEAPADAPAAEAPGDSDGGPGGGPLPGW